MYNTNVLDSLLFQYGRKDIEHTLKKKSHLKQLKYDEGNIEDTLKGTSSITDLRAAPKINGIKNGIVNGTSHVISRDDNLILVPEPTNKQFDEETIPYEENKVIW